MLYQSYFDPFNIIFVYQKSLKILEIGQWEQQMGSCANFMHSLQILREFGRYFASYSLRQASKNLPLVNEKEKLKT